MSKRPISVCSGPSARLADAAELRGVLVRLAVGRRRIGRVRNPVVQAVELRLGRGRLGLERPQVGLQRLRLLELFRRRLALSFWRARGSSGRGISARQRSSASSRASNSSSAPFRASAARKLPGSWRAA